jgi:ABC-type antimicrobial peptide transport system permease subunit
MPLPVDCPLGAKRVEIFSTIMRRFALEVLFALVMGIAITAAISQIFRRFLYGISSLDLISYANSIGLLVLILVSATALPVRRAFRIDIARTLHSD